MSSNKITSLFICGVTMFSSVVSVVPALAKSAPLKPPTVEQRQAKLMQDINAAQKANKLNAKQSKKMRKKLAEIARDKKSMKSKHNGKLTADDIAKLNSELDDAGNDLKDENK